MLTVPCVLPVGVAQAAREKVHTAIKNKLDAAIVSRSKADEKFQSFVSEELAAIKNSIRVESQVRQRGVASACF